MVPWSHWRQPFSGWMMTVLTSEFTHFNLVIHLSKLKQSALRFTSLFESPAAPAVPWEPWEMHSSLGCRTEQPQTSVFAATFAVTRHHVKTLWKGRHTSFRCGLFSFWLSGEVKHIVHLIRWNLKAVICPCGWLEHGPGLAQRTNFRSRSWILLFY